MKLEVTPVFDFIYSNYIEYKDKVDKIGFVLEGSSGSSKTVSIIQFLLTYSQYSKDKKITCGRSKMTWVIDSIWSDTNEYFQLYNQNYIQNKSKYRITHNANTFRFVGADDPQKFHGPRQDVFWFNEAMELDRASFDQVDQRTNDLFFLDYNPSMTKHWIFNRFLTNLEPKGEGYFKIMDVKNGDEVIKVAVFYLKSTFEMNPFLPAGQRAKILSYNPDVPENVENNTADEYMWRIYGLGLRAQPRGLVFPNWKEYTDLPQDLDLYTFFGLDFGNTDPNALVEVNISRKHKVMFIKEHLYESDVRTPDLIDRTKVANPENKEVICDSARPDKIYDLQDAGIFAMGVKKPKIEPSIDIMKQFTIYVHSHSENAKEEFNMYKYVEDGTRTQGFKNVPIDNFNHAIDAARYVCTYFFFNYC